MKFVAGIYIVIILLKSFLPAMNTAELAKIPVLIEHYREHCNIDPSLTFLQFLALHYADEKHHRHDHSKHSKLPFGNMHHHPVTLQLWYAELPGIVLQPGSSKIFIVLLAEDNNPIIYKSAIWQPPRYSLLG